MTASILDGKHVANSIQQHLIKQVHDLTQRGLRAPCLAVIRVGLDPASIIYVQNKIKACKAVGFRSISYELSQQTNEETLIQLISELNQNTDVDGILVQLPLPKHINNRRIIEHISAAKDVDGFHPYNLGRLAQGEPTLRPCTPYGIIQLLRHYQLSPHGLNAVIVGASNIVGRPMALEFLLAQATVTLCHRATRLLEQHVRMADIIVCATGHYDVVKPEWLHQQQIIIDVGIHRQPNGVLHGDINTAAAMEKVAWITPVPGGVGPMTIATLLQNTWLIATTTHS